MNTALLLTAAAVLLSACGTTAPTATSGSSGTAVSGVNPYPLKTCIVTGNELGSMGDDQSFVYQGQEIKVCCEPCVAKFHKNPQKYLAGLR